MMVGTASTAATSLLFSAAFLCGVVQAVITEITPAELEAGIESGKFRAVIDIRTRGEWDRGHIRNATLIESLASAGSLNEVTNAADLAGCEYCNLAIYCNSGQRADRAIAYLDANGFQSLFDAAGIVQWLDSGRELVNTESEELPCVITPEARCAAINETIAVTDDGDQEETNGAGSETGTSTEETNGAGSETGTSPDDTPAMAPSPNVEENGDGDNVDKDMMPTTDSESSSVAGSVLPAFLLTFVSGLYASGLI